MADNKKAARPSFPQSASRPELEVGELAKAFQEAFNHLESRIKALESRANEAANAKVAPSAQQQPSDPPPSEAT